MRGFDNPNFIDDFGHGTTSPLIMQTLTYKYKGRKVSIKLHATEKEWEDITWNNYKMSPPKTKVEHKAVKIMRLAKEEARRQSVKDEWKRRKAMQYGGP